jgi:hypothetical protein
MSKKTMGLVDARLLLQGGRELVSISVTAPLCFHNFATMATRQLFHGWPMGLCR